MSFFSRVVTSSLIVGSLFMAGNSYAHSVHCVVGHYLLVLQNQYNYAGTYNVSCTNGQQIDQMNNLYLAPLSTLTVVGNFNGNVTCIILGASSSVSTATCVQ
jgi:phage-related protein